MVESMRIQVPLTVYLMPLYASNNCVIFSVAGNVLNEKQNGLLPENLDKLVLLLENPSDI